LPQPSRRGGNGALEFRRADGRTIPASGYRLEDMQDDELADDPSKEGFCGDSVRERGRVYRIRPRRH
jgi:hypothetical protein